MSDLPATTDETLEAERRQGVHKRAEKIDDHMALAFIFVMWFAAIIGAIIAVYFVVLYSVRLKDAPDATAKIETIATHVFAVAGGYLVSFLKRHIKRD